VVLHRARGLLDEVMAMGDWRRGRVGPVLVLPPPMVATLYRPSIYTVTDLGGRRAVPALCALEGTGRVGSFTTAEPIILRSCQRALT